MGLSVYMFAGREDNRAFSEYVQSLGLRMYPILMERAEIQPADDPAEYPFAYLSPMPMNELHPYGDPPGIGSATDPLIDWMRPYFKNPDLLVIGSLYCSNDVRTLFSVTKPYFSKLRSWVRTNWKKLPTGQYIGPEAVKLMESGVKLAYFPPGVQIETKYI